MMSRCIATVIALGAVDAKDMKPVSPHGEEESPVSHIRAMPDEHEHHSHHSHHKTAMLQTHSKAEKTECTKDDDCKDNAKNKVCDGYKKQEGTKDEVKGKCAEKKDADDGSSCFAGDAMVDTLLGARSMASLVVGDEVRTASGFEAVMGFLHAEDIAANFYDITTPTGVLPVSAEHLVFTAAGEAVKASSIQVGDVLSSGVVSDVKQVTKQGVYAPLTQSGTIVVEGVTASCYANIAHPLAHAAMTPMRYFGISSSVTSAAPVAVFPISA